MKKILGSLLCAILVTTLCGCPHHRIPPHNPNPPPLAAPVLPQNESVIPVTATVDLTPIKNEIITTIQNNAGRFDNPDMVDAQSGKHFRYTFTLKPTFTDRNVGAPPNLKIPILMPGRIEHVYLGPNIIVNFENGRIYLTVKYMGDIESKFFPGCHLNPDYPIINLNFRPGIVQKDDNFVLGALDPECDITLDQGSDTQCGVFGFENIFVKVKEGLLNALNGPAVISKITSTVEKQNKTIPSKALFGAFGFNVAGFSNIWFYPNPSQISAGNLSGSLSSAQLNFQYEGYPSVVIGTNPPPSVPGPIESTPAITPPPGNPLTVFIPIAISYPEINQELSDYFSNSTNSEVPMGNYQLKIEKIYAANAQGRILLSVTFSGFINGTIYLWGTPQIEASGTSVDIPDLQLDIKSKTILDRIKLGLAELVFGDLKKKIDVVFPYDFSKKLNQAKNTLSGKHDFGKVSLVLNLNPQLAPGRDTIYSRDEAIVVNVFIQGSAQATINGF